MQMLIFMIQDSRKKLDAGLCRGKTENTIILHSLSLAACSLFFFGCDCQFLTRASSTQTFSVQRTLLSLITLIISLVSGILTASS